MDVWPAPPSKAEICFNNNMKWERNEEGEG